MSKRCCPTCREILNHLRKELNSGELKPFFVEGTHKTVSGCSIPHWFAEQLKQRIVNDFCAKLRKELALFFSLPAELSETQGHGPFDSHDSEGFDTSSDSASER